MSTGYVIKRKVVYGVTCDQEYRYTYIVTK